MKGNYEKGFTLIEILVVMVLLGLLSGVAIFTLGSGKLQRELEVEAQRLHTLLRMASEEAILSNSEIGFSIDDDHYEFLEYDDEKQTWASSSVSVLKMRDLPEWLAPEFETDGQARILGKDSSDSDETKRPDMMLLSSGEVTPFSISLRVRNKEEGGFIISSDGLEEIKLITPGKEEE